jgi:drug/metabolite transporter (DMT)-like permease
LNHIAQPGVRQRAVANAYMFLQTMLWGLSFIWTKNINAEMPTIAYLALRFLIATVMMILPLLLARRIRSAFSPTFFRASLVLGGLLFASMMLQTYGLNLTSVTNSSFITSTTVVIVPIFERVLFKKKLSPALWAGVIIAFAGITVLSGGLSETLNLGDVLTLLCAIGFALHMVLAAKYGEQHQADGLGASQIVVAAVLFTAVWAAYGFNLDGFRPGLLFGIVVMALTGTTLGFVGMVVALKYTRPSIAAD